MTLTIDHYPNRAFAFCSCTPKFLITESDANVRVDINLAVKSKLKENETLTNATALMIFKQIKCKSNVLSFLTKPVFLISLSVAICVGSFYIPAVGTAYACASLFTGILGGGMLGFSIQNSWNGFLFQLSQAYRDQSARAAEYIAQLEKAAGVEFTFVLP